MTSQRVTGYKPVMAKRLPVMEKKRFNNLNYIIIKTLPPTASVNKKRIIYTSSILFMHFLKADVIHTLVCE